MRTIGSYRTVINSLGKRKSIKIYDKIKHHPMLSTLTFIPHLPYPKKHFGMSNLDLKLKIDNNKIYINLNFRKFLKTKFSL